MIFLVITAVAAIITFLASRVVLRLALRYGIHPPVRERDVHSRPTPRLGGAAMCLGLLGAFGVAALIPELSGIFAEPVRIWTLLAGAVAICALGVLDDLYDLDWMLKLGAQILVATGVAIFGVQIVSLPIGGLTVPSSTMAISLTVLLIVLVMNAVNFIDGLDGLVAGTTIIGSTAFFGYIFVISANLGQPNAYFSLASLITSIIVGVCIGFLPVNWHPARMFMGDGGALMLGLLTAASAIAVTGQIDLATMGGRSQILPAFIPILLPLAILLLPLTDFVPRRRAQAPERLEPLRRRPQAPAPPAARHGPLAPRCGAHLLRVDGRRLRRLPAVPHAPALVGGGRYHGGWIPRVRGADGRAGQPARVADAAARAARAPCGAQGTRALTHAGTHTRGRIQ